MQVPREMKIKYLSRRLEDIHNLRLRMDLGDYSFALKVGHQIKGNAVTFGVPQIASIGHELEKAAQKKDPEKLKILIKKMEALVYSAQSLYLMS
jgi:HPt (histidine-containing phosphotransfer) domain-containing protein